MTFLYIIFLVALLLYLGLYFYPTIEPKIKPFIEDVKYPFSVPQTYAILGGILLVLWTVLFFNRNTHRPIIYVSKQEAPSNITFVLNKVPEQKLYQFTIMFPESNSAMNIFLAEPEVDQLITQFKTFKK